MLKVKLITHTPDPDKLVAEAAKLCYSASDIDSLEEKLTPEKVEQFLDRLVDIGHESPVEHASFTFGIEGVNLFCDFMNVVSNFIRGSFFRSNFNDF